MAQRCIKIEEARSEAHVRQTIAPREYYGEAAGVNPDETVSLRVIRICGEYWAKWGAAARPRAVRSALFVPAYAQFARLAALPG
jgi:hypothetical protein